MDLSKLNKTLQPDAQTSIDTERIVTTWMEDSANASGKTGKENFKNIKITRFPAYYFKFGFQTVERDFAESQRPANSNDVGIAKTDGTIKFPLESFSFNEFALSDVPFDEEKEENHSIVKTHIRCDCPDCKGQGKFTCSSCNGVGTYRCSSCKEHIGWILCPSCDGEGRKLYGNEWKTCRKCLGDKKIHCPNCGGSGKINCPDCKGKGYNYCKTCGGFGEIVKYIAINDNFEKNMPAENFVVCYDKAVPDKLRELLKGDTPVTDKQEICLRSFAREEPVLESDDKIDDVLQALNIPQFSKVKERIEELKNQIEFSAVEETRNFSIRILKSRITVYQIDLVRVSYEYDGKPYELWLYGKDKLIFNETNPFLSKAKSLEDEAEELRKQKKPTEAIKKYEEAFRIAEASKNYKALHIYHNRLKYTRIDSNKDFSIGLYIGLALTAVFYLLAIKKLPLDYPTSAGVFTDVLSIQSEKAVSILSKITNVLANYVAPFALFYVLLFNCVRDKIKNKIARIALACALPVLYTAVMTLLFSKVAAFTPSVFVMTGGAVLLATIIIACTVKVPYSKIPSQFDDVDLEKSTEKIAEKESGKNVSLSDNADDFGEISTKHRAIALVLSLFVGFIGVHRFYVGKVKSGLLQLAVFIAASFFAGGVEGEPDSAKPMLGGIILGILGIWVFVDFILICAGKFKDKYGDRIKNW